MVPAKTQHWALGLGFLGRVPAKTQHWACRSWDRAAQGLFRAQITRLNRWLVLRVVYLEYILVVSTTVHPYG